MIHDFCAKFLKNLRLLKEDGIHLLSEGKAQNFEEYRYMCGKIRGLNAAESMVKALIDEMLEGNKILEDMPEQEADPIEGAW